MSQVINFINPFTQGPLQEQSVGLSENGAIVFPYKNGAYRLVEDDNYTQNFGYQWNKFAATQIDRGQKNVQLSYNRFFAVTGWDKEDLQDKNILEVGSGAGRFSQIVLDHTAANLYSIDYSNAVEANFKNNGHHKERQIGRASCRERVYSSV